MSYHKFTFLVAITIIEGIEMVENISVQKNGGEGCNMKGKLGLLVSQCFLVHVFKNGDKFSVCLYFLYCKSSHFMTLLRWNKPIQTTNPRQITYFILKKKNTNYEAYLFIVWIGWWLNWTCKSVRGQLHRNIVRS